jgi:hypothetical protein
MLERQIPRNPALVPSVAFFDIPKHRQVLRS